MSIFRPASLVAMACLLSIGQNGLAGNVTWDGGAGTQLWSDAGNWSPNGVPASTADVHLVDLNSTNIINLNGNQTIKSLTYSGGDFYEIKGNTLTITSGDITDNSSAAQLISSKLSFSSASVINLGTGANLALNGTTTGASLNMTGGGLLTLQGTTTFTGAITISGGSLQINTVSLQAANIVNNSALNYAKMFSASTISAAISGSGHLNFLDTDSTLTLTGNNTFTGGVFFTSNSFGDIDTLQIGDGGTSGTLTSDVSTFSSSRLVFNRSDSTTYAGGIIGTGQVTQAGAGILTLSGASSYSGGTNLNAGLIRFSAVENLGTEGLNFNGGGLQWAAGSSVGSLTRTITINSGGATLDTNGNDVTITKAIGNGGSGALTKTGSGTLTLSGANTYSGGTNFKMGTVRISTLSNLGTGNLTFDGGTLQWAAGSSVDVSARVVTINSEGATIDTNDNEVTFVNAIGNGGSGALTKIGLGALTLSGTNTYSGGTNLQNGVVLFAALSNLGTGGLNFDGGTLKWDTGATADISTRTVTFNSGGAVLNTGANNVTLANPIGNGGSGSLTKLGGGILTLAGDNIFTGTISINGGTVSLGDGGTTGSLLSDVFINDSSTLRFNRTGTLNYSGDISGQGTLQKQGTGTVQLTGTNTSSGNITISDGALAIGAGGSSGSISADVLNNATLIFNRLTDYSYGWNISGTGTLYKMGSNTLTLSGTNTQTGVTHLEAGTLAFSALSNLGSGSLTFDGGKLQWASGNTTDISTRTVLIDAGGGTIDTNSNDVTFANTIGNGGSGTLIKTGLGSLTLSGNNTYTGTTIVSTGTLRIGNGGATGSVIGNISNSAAVAFNRSGLAFDYNGVISGAGTVSKAGNTTLRLGGTNTFTGNLTIDGGAVAVGTGGATGSIIADVINNATLIFNRTSDYTYAGDISGSGEVYKVNANKLTLSGSNSYSSGTFIEGGTLAFNSLSNLGTSGVTFGGGTLEWIAGNAADLSGRTVTIDAGGATFNVNGNTVTLANAIGNSGSGSLTKTGNGMLTLAGNNTYTGLTSINSGTLQIGNGGTTGSVAGDISNAGALIFNRSNTTDYAGILSGTGSFTKTGSGNLRLSGSNTFTGTTTISGGALVIGAGGSTGSLGGNIVNNSSLVFNRTTDTTHAGQIGGTGSLFKTNVNTLTLTGSNSYAGTTHIEGGVLQFFSLSNLGSGSAIRLSGGTLQWALGNTADISMRTVTIDSGGAIFNTNGNNVTLANSIGNGGSGALTKAGAGVLTLGGNNSYAGGTRLVGGTIAFSSLANLGSGGLTFQGGALRWGSGNTTDISSRTVTIDSGGATLNTNGNDVTLASAIGNGGSGALTKTGSGVLTLVGVNTWSGGARIEGGTLAFTSLANLGSGALAFDGGTLRWLGTTDISSRTVTIDSGGATFDTNGNNVTLASAIGNSGDGGLTKTGLGTLVLTGNNTYTGPTTVSAGNLKVNGSIAASSLTTVGGTGTLSGGGIVGDIALNSGGTISPGNSPGTMTTGDEDWNGGANYVWEINKADGTQGIDPGWDFLDIGGALTINSSIESPFIIKVDSLTLGNISGQATGFTYGQTYHWIIATATGGVANFSADKFLIDTSAFLNQHAANVGGFTITNSGNDLLLNLTYVPEPGTWAAAAFLVLLVLAKRRRA